MMIVVAAGCGEKGEETSGATASGSTSEGVSAGTTTQGATGTTDEPTGTAGGTSGVGTTTEATSTTGTTGTTEGTETSVGTSGATTGGGGSACAGGCSEDEWCDSPVNQCAEDPNPGECKARPTGCDDILLPVCGCDGKVYPNECEAQAVGVDVGEGVDCEPPEGLFQCGFIFCDPGSQFCVVQISDVGGFPDEYQCQPLPDNCEPASCDCLKDTPCGFNCAPAEDGGFTTICPGG